MPQQYSDCKNFFSFQNSIFIFSFNYRDKHAPKYQPRATISKEEYETLPTKFIFGDSNVPVYGSAQAQVLTNTTQFNAFPEEIENKISNIKLPTAIERSMNQAVLVSHLLDAEQVKHYERFPITPEKPKHLKPRHYTISDERKK